MIEVVGVRFKKAGKLYYFDPDGLKINEGNHVIVETVRGIEYGTAIKANTMVADDDVVQPLKKVIRVATKEDDECEAENRNKEKEAFSVCEEKIAKHGLDMKLIDVEITFDHNKLIFYFTSDERVDFRELVKELAAVFRTRIELRQIGVRDEAKMMNGIGICGRPLCCATFLGDFQPVSIKMAKEQGLSLSPVKISGTCGRLMCCLKYEQEAYTDLLKHTPKVGAIVNTPEGRGLVVENNLIAGTLKVKLNNTPEDAAPKSFTVKQCKLVKDGYIKLDKKEMEKFKGLE